MFAFSNEADLNRRATEISQASSLHEVIELSCIAVTWNSIDGNEYAVKSAYSRLRSISERTIRYFIACDVSRLSAIADQAKRVEMIDYTLRYEWSTLRGLARSIYDQAKAQLTAAI